MQVERTAGKKGQERIYRDQTCVKINAYRLSDIRVDRSDTTLTEPRYYTHFHLSTIDSTLLELMPQSETLPCVR